MLAKVICLRYFSAKLASNDVLVQVLTIAHYRRRPELRINLGETVFDLDKYR